MKKSRFSEMGRGKYPLLADIERHLPKGECLIEPFVGAGSVFLNTSFSRYILADINSDLIGLYNIVKERADEYVQGARELFTPATNQSETYYQLRTEFNQSQDLSGARCYSCTLTATAITACVVIICAVNLTYRLAATKNRTSRKLSCIISLKRRRMPFLLRILCREHGACGCEFGGLLRSALRTALSHGEFYGVPYE
jgi:hypothetical protein